MSDSNLIETLEQLLAHYPEPRASSQAKIQDCLSESMQRWLQRSPFFVLSSIAADGIDCSPRGDMPGKSFRILDERTIAIPDRRGNNRIDTLRNILVNPLVGMVFLIPGIDQALRVRGNAQISVAPSLLETMTLDDETPATVLLISVTAAFVQNARAVRSAELWATESHASPADLPSVHELLISGSP